MEFLEEFKLPNKYSIFDLDYYRKKPEVFAKFAKEFLMHEDHDGVILNQPKLTHKFVKYLNNNDMLYRYFTSNIENSEEGILPKIKVCHVYGAMKTFENERRNQTACSKCGKMEKTYKLLSSFHNMNVPRCKADISYEEIFSEINKEK